MSVSILVVDDEPDVAELFRQRFRREARQGTYVMHFADSGEEALEQLADGIEPKLIVILSDINMPGMDGLQLLRRDQAALPRSAGDDGDRLWRRRAPPPRQRARCLRVHYQAGRFRPAEGAAAPAACRRGLRFRCDFNIYCLACGFPCYIIATIAVSERGASGCKFAAETANTARVLSTRPPLRPAAPDRRAPRACRRAIRMRSCSGRRTLCPRSA